jgi:hypothetical protein
VIINIIEANERSAKRKGQLRKLMFLCVEAIQNIQRYSAHDKNFIDSSLVFFDGIRYTILTRNAVEKKNASELRSRLDDLAKKNKEELEEMYAATLSSEESTEKGSGLGLIEIARKSNHNFYYEISVLDGDLSLFDLSFSLTVDSNNAEESDLSGAMKLHKNLNDNFNNSNSCFLYSGDFSNSFLTSILELLFLKKNEDLVNTNRKNHHIIIELVQNIKRHAKRKEDSSKGKLILEWDGDGLTIDTLNWAETKHVEEIAKKILSLNSSNKEQLEKKSREMLSDLEATNGLGLIDIASLIFPSKIEMSVGSVKDEFSELHLKLKVANG